MPDMTAARSPLKSVRGDLVNGSSASAVFVLSHHELYGDVRTGQSRILDVLNDSNTRFLRLDNVRVRRPEIAEPQYDLPGSVVVKENIHIVLLLGEDRPSESKVFYAARERKTHVAVATLPTMVIEGRVHLKSVQDPQSFLTFESAMFFPITDAVLWRDAYRSEPQRSPVALVNTRMLSSLSFDHAERNLFGAVR
jgi:hypothetical protein